MSTRRTTKRMGKLMSQGDFIKQLAKEKGYNEQDLKILFSDMLDHLIDNLASGISIHLFPGIMFEIREHNASMSYDLKKKEMVMREPFPFLKIRVTDRFKHKIFAYEVDDEDDEEE